MGLQTLPKLKKQINEAVKNNDQVALDALLKEVNNGNYISKLPNEEVYIYNKKLIEYIQTSN